MIFLIILGIILLVIAVLLFSPVNISISLLVAPADVTILLAGGVLVTLLVKDAAAVGTKEYAGE